MIDGYTDVAVVVSDAQKAKQWYVEKLGFKVVLDRGHVICGAQMSRKVASTFTFAETTLLRWSRGILE